MDDKVEVKTAIGESFSISKEDAQKRFETTNKLIEVCLTECYALALSKQDFFELVNNIAACICSAKESYFDS